MSATLLETDLPIVFLCSFLLSSCLARRELRRELRRETLYLLDHKTFLLALLMRKLLSNLCTAHWLVAETQHTQHTHTRSQHQTENHNYRLDMRGVAGVNREREKRRIRGGGKLSRWWMNRYVPPLWPRPEYTSALNSTETQRKITTVHDVNTELFHRY